MSNNEWEQDNDGDGIRNLRKAYKESQKELASMREQISALTAQSRVANVNEALASRGLDPRVARFYPTDAQADEESISKWVAENGDLFAGRRVTDDEGATDETTLTDSEKRGYQIQQDMAAYDNAVHMDLKSRLDQIKFDGNPDAAQEEVLRVLKEFSANMSM